MLMHTYVRTCTAAHPPSAEMSPTSLSLADTPIPMMAPEGNCIILSGDRLCGRQSRQHSHATQWSTREVGGMCVHYTGACVSTHSVRYDHIHLPDGTVCILSIPQCGCVWVGRADQALDADIASHPDFSQWFHFKHRAVLCDVGIVNSFIVPHLVGVEQSTRCTQVDSTHVLVVQRRTDHKALARVCERVSVSIRMYVRTLTNPSAPAVISSPSSRYMASTTPCTRRRGHGTHHSDHKHTHKHPKQQCKTSAYVHTYVRMYMITNARNGYI